MTRKCKSSNKPLQDTNNNTGDDTKATIKAGAYIRVSTDEQAENGYSLQMQEERITAQIIAKGWDLHKVYIDGGQSGGKLERPALQEMLADIEKGDLN